MEESDKASPLGNQDKIKVKSNDKVNLSLEDLDDLPEIHCATCDVKFNSVSSYELHINGKKHKQKVKAIEMMKHLNVNDGEPATSEASDSIPDTLYCDVCKLHCCGYKPYMQHLKSHKHMKQLNKAKLNDHLRNTPEVLPHATTDEDEDNDVLMSILKPYGRCGVCSKTFGAPETLKQHMESPAHFKKVAQAKMKTNIINSIENQPNSSVTIADQSALAADDWDIKSFAECKICEKKFSGPEPFQMHLISASHLRKVKIQQMEEDMKSQNVDTHVSTEGKYVCEECGKMFENFIELKQHLYSNLHAKQAVKKDIVGFLEKHPEIAVIPSSDGNSSQDPSATDADFYICKYCNNSFSGPESAKQHVMGKTHKRATEIIKRLKMCKLNDVEAALSATISVDKPDKSDAKIKSLNSSKNEPSENAMLLNDGNDKDDFEVI